MTPLPPAHLPDRVQVLLPYRGHTAGEVLIWEAEAHAYGPSGPARQYVSAHWIVAHWLRVFRPVPTGGQLEFPA